MMKSVKQNVVEIEGEGFLALMDQRITVFCMICTHWMRLPTPPNAAGEVRRNAVTSTGLLAVSGSGDK